ncbi:nuclease-related domain-containing protein [Halomonas sp. YLGW01]|uniref:nuclease-related domain-containing protein n=1 Tax=Halomonas sp. YLGW01 TaxID=2773308 RepID=UPI00177FA4F7|nr:nuclease-related domain-containing protein [Halomonas sp. YLGW01]
MILKEKDACSSADARDSDMRGYYGHKQEQDVAFHLRREFGEHDQIHIINDLRIEHKGERAQIDHLVIHPFGFIIIESKSIVGEVKVNAEGEWSRSYQGNWRGMPSPIRQAELQLKLLRSFLGANVEHFLGKLLGIQIKVRGRDWKTLCAVSSSAILHRDMMPNDVSAQVVKTEFLAGKIRELVGSMSLAPSFMKGKPRFAAQELEDIGSFLLANDEKVNPAHEEVTSSAMEVAEAPAVPYSPLSRMSADEASTDSLAATHQPIASASSEIQDTSAESLVACKSCGEVECLTGMYGQYGYYVKCKGCGTNTSLKQPCPACEWKSVRVNKDGPTYTATCRKCEHQYLVFRQEAE